MKKKKEGEGGGGGTALLGRIASLGPTASTLRAAQIHPQPHVSLAVGARTLSKGRACAFGFPHRQAGPKCHIHLYPHRLALGITCRCAMGPSCQLHTMFPHSLTNR